MTVRGRRAWPVLLLAAGSLVGAVAFGVVLPRTVFLARASSESSALLVVADLRGHALVAFDPAHPEDARRFALSGGPHELLRLPDGRIVASLEQSGALAVVDLVTGLVETVTLGGLPHGLASDGTTLYVTDRAQGAIRRLAPGTWHEDAPLPDRDTPHALATLPDGTLAVANAATSTLALGDNVIAVSELPETVAVSSDGARVATAGARGNSVQVFTADGAPLVNAMVGERPVRVAFDSAHADRVAAALSADGSVALVEGDGSVRTVAVGGVPDGLAFTPDGRTLYSGEVSEGVVSAIDVAGGRVTAQYDIGESAGALLFVPRPASLGGQPVTVVRK